LDFAFASSQSSHIVCPCSKCNNSKWKKRKDVYEDVICQGFTRNYTCWIFHGEDFGISNPSTTSRIEGENVEEFDDMHGMVQDLLRNQMDANELHDENMEDSIPVGDQTTKLYQYLEDAEEELYPGCKLGLTKLSFITRLFHLKCVSKWINSSFNKLLEFFADVLPDGAHVPKNHYETKKMMNNLGFGYNKIHACPNSCILYWKELSEAISCPVCGVSRWKVVEIDEDDEDIIATTSKKKNKQKKIPAKVLRHFPIKDRLQRLFSTKNVALSMRWHDENRKRDGVLRHPADSEVWHAFDRIHPFFACEPRNVRLGLASDGFQPFRGSAHSTWPLILVVDNLPPWMCMKHPYFIMSLLIPGPQAPGNDIDVYLQPLIEELKELWVSGVNTYDASRKETFSMRCALLWTINDFPAYANLSGWSTKGRFACPCCQGETCSRWLTNSRKFCYMGHRRWLDENHLWRKDKRHFDGSTEQRSAPVALTGDAIFDQVKEFEVVFGKGQPHADLGKDHSWKKRSIFFELPYWKDILVRHNLDAMHIEKNVCDSLLSTVVGVLPNSKDNLKSRKDLQLMNIRKDLHPHNGPNEGKFKPAAFWMKKNEQKNFCRVLKFLKVPNGFSSNISRCVKVKERKLHQLKSHDCHILMQELLPLALRRSHGVKHVRKTVIDLCQFFRGLCSKEFRVVDFLRLEKKISHTLCELEMIFPPSFFDIMLHLPIHLAKEASLCGPVYYRWMYPFER